MKISQPVKLLIGIGTVWILLYPLIFVGLVPIMFMASPEFMPFDAFVIIVPFHILTAFIQIILMFFYLIHVIKNKTASEIVRVILGIGLFFMPFVAMPVYYYLYIWRDPPPDWALADLIIGERKEKKKPKPISSKNLLLLLVVVAVNLCICLILASIFYATS